MEKQYKSGRNDLLTGLVFCLFSGAYFIMATQIAIPTSMKSSLLDASSVPRLWGIMMFVLGVIILIRGLKKMSDAKKGGYCPPQGGQFEKVKKSIWEARSAIAMFVILFAYIAVLQSVGFLVSTIVFLFLEFFVLTRKEERKLWVIALMALVFGVAIYALFKYGFNMPLPRGIVKFF